jgi:putative endonuclease
MVNQSHTVLYVGVAADLYARVVEHREKHKPRSFSARYNINKLVYYETFRSIEEAIDREKQLKKYSRVRKVELIRDFNRDWKDLYDVIKYW